MYRYKLSRTSSVIWCLKLLNTDSGALSYCGRLIVSQMHIPKPGANLMLAPLAFVNISSKVDNLYFGSKQSRPLQNRYCNTPLVHWTHAIGCHIQARWHESPRKVPNYSLLLGEQRYIGVNNLRKVFAGQCRAAGSRTHDLSITSPTR